MNILLEDAANKRSARKAQEEHLRTFPQWFEMRIMQSELGVSDMLYNLSKIPRTQVVKHSGYIINGVRFTTEKRDKLRVTQNSGVCLVAETMQYASAKDKHPINSDMIYYGVIKEIWEIDYLSFRTPVFLCDWVESNGGVKVNAHGSTLVDLKRHGHKREPFVMATHVKQVFYVTSQSDSKWSYVFATQSKDYANEVQKEFEESDVLFEHLTPTKGLTTSDTNSVVDDENDALYLRKNVEGIWVYIVLTLKMLLLF